MESEENTSPNSTKSEKPSSSVESQRQHDLNNRTENLQHLLSGLELKVQSSFNDIQEQYSSDKKVNTASTSSTDSCFTPKTVPAEMAKGNQSSSGQYGASMEDCGPENKLPTTFTEIAKLCEKEPFPYVTLDTNRRKRREIVSAFQPSFVEEMARLSDEDDSGFVVVRRRQRRSHRQSDEADDQPNIEQGTSRAESALMREEHVFRDGPANKSWNRTVVDDRDRSPIALERHGEQAPKQRGSAMIKCYGGDVLRLRDGPAIDDRDPSFAALESHSERAPKRYGYSSGDVLRLRDGPAIDDRDPSFAALEPDSERAPKRYGYPMTKCSSGDVLRLRDGPAIDDRDPSFAALEPHSEPAPKRYGYPMTKCSSGDVLRLRDGPANKSWDGAAIEDYDGSPFESCGVQGIKFRSRVADDLRGRSALEFGDERGGQYRSMFESPEELSGNDSRGTAIERRNRSVPAEVYGGPASASRDNPRSHGASAVESRDKAARELTEPNFARSEGCEPAVPDFERAQRALDSKFERDAWSYMTGRRDDNKVLNYLESGSSRVAEAYKYADAGAPVAEPLLKPKESGNENEPSARLTSAWKKLPEANKKEVYDDDLCRICLLPFLTKGKNWILECGHKFHQQCIDQWLVLYAICPLCKQRVLAPKDFPKL